MLVRTALALWILGMMVVGVVGFPASVQYQKRGQQRQIRKRQATPFSFIIDWDKIGEELDLFLNELKTTNSLTSSSLISTKLAPQNTASSTVSTTIHTPPNLPVSPNPSPSTVSSLSSIHSSTPFSSHSFSSSPSPSSHSPSSSLSSSSSSSGSSLSSEGSRPSSSSTIATSTKPTPTTISTVSTRTGAPSIQPPYFVIYTDESAFGFPTSKQIEGFNILALSFFLSNSKAADQAAAWAQLPASERTAIRADYKANNISLMVSVLGSTEAPTTQGIDPVKYAQDVAAWAIEFDMDGVDVDYEDFDAVGTGKALDWLVKFTTTLRSALLDNMVLTHAPVAPWLSKSEVYFQLEQEVGPAIDWYNVQFYSQGLLYTTCDSLLTTSGGAFPSSSLFELIAGGIPAKKLVIGKPGTLVDVGVSSDLLGIGSVGSDPVVQSSSSQQQSKRDLVKRASVTNTNGFMETSLLAKCLVTAISQGWSTGVMAWEYPDANNSWIQNVRSLAFPLPN